MTELSFGEWLKSHRRTRGWTQKELALQLHCSTSSLRKMEAEQRKPSSHVVDRLCEIFDIPPGQRNSFLQFARGDWQAVSSEETGNSLRQVSPVTPHADLPASMTSLIGREEVDELLRLAHESPNVVEKLALLHQTLELAEALGDVRRQVDSLWQLGWSDQSNRFMYWEKAIGLARRLGAIQELANYLSTTGFFHVLNGDIKTAQKYLDESSALYQKLNMKPTAVHLLSAQGQIALLRGDFDTARMYLQEHARIALEFGSREDYLWAQVRLGYVALHAGNREEAHRIFIESTGNFQKEKIIIGVVFSLEGMAGLYVQAGKLTPAARLVGWADDARKRINNTRPLLEQADVHSLIADCRSNLGETAFLDAYHAGKKMTLDDAVAYALDGD